MRKFFLYWMPVVLYLLLIFILSSFSNPPVPKMLSFSLLHVIEYSVLTMLFLRAFFAYKTCAMRAFFIAIIITVVYGISDELHQSFVPNRVPDVMDIAMDGLGAMLGSFIYYIIYLFTRTWVLF